jgi:hypothetical protein
VDKSIPEEGASLGTLENALVDKSIPEEEASLGILAKALADKSTPEEGVRGLLAAQSIVAAGRTQVKNRFSWEMNIGYPYLQRIISILNGARFAYLQIAIHNAIERLNRSRSMRHHLESIGMPEKEAKQLVEQFSAKVVQNEVPEVSHKVIDALAADALEVGMSFESMGTRRETAIAGKLDRVLWDAFFTHCEGMFPPDVERRLERMRSIADLRYPAEWNPKSRMMKR